MYVLQSLFISPFFLIDNQLFGASCLENELLSSIPNRRPRSSMMLSKKQIASRTHRSPKRFSHLLHQGQVPRLMAWGYRAWPSWPGMHVPSRFLCRSIPPSFFWDFSWGTGGMILSQMRPWRSLVLLQKCDLHIKLITSGILVLIWCLSTSWVQWRKKTQRWWLWSPRNFFFPTWGLQSP